MVNAPAPQCQPMCATPPDDLMRLADAIAKARDEYLDAYMNDYPFLEDKQHDLERLLWNDKGTFAPALRQAAEVATLTARNRDLEARVEGLTDFVAFFTAYFDNLPPGTPLVLPADKVARARAALLPGTPAVSR